MNIVFSSQLVGVLGYLSFGEKVGTNIITMYPSTSLFVCIGRLSIVVLTLCSYPLQVHPCRAAFDKVFSLQSTLATENSQEGQRSSIYQDQTSNEEEDALVFNHESNQEAAAAAATSQVSITSRRLEEMSNQKLCILTGLILISTFIVALCVDDLGLILGFVGSVGSTSISFILPGILFSSLHKTGHRSQLRRRAQILALYGCIVMVVCLAANIVKVYKSIGNSNVVLPIILD